MVSKRYRVLLGALLTTTVLCTGVAVNAQSQAPVWDPSQLPETKGIIKQYTLTPRGEVDGLILNDGTEVKFSFRQRGVSWPGQKRRERLRLARDDAVQGINAALKTRRLR